MSSHKAYLLGEDFAPSTDIAASLPNKARLADVYIVPTADVFALSFKGGNLYRYNFLHHPERNK
ncbi:hypothetical protein [Sphingobacterium sp. SGR-19]|uniref:hypothetical protein n=1 Tax=Sphingobacterium sp. SGR-19 TaxID=2710886 RepID=UPI0013EBD55E|nr:hypothetical protein [Sphingobacterium sp. SGR-19]NGM63746.1 hypothetical protein [Sphingobacterium sp. SGR-19]